TAAATTTRISVDVNGADPNNPCSSPSISGDGNLVVFSSFASDLVFNDLNGASDVFLCDVAANTMAIVSNDSSGTEGALASDPGRISADASPLAFASDAATPVAAATNFVRDVFLHDVASGTTTRVSVDSLGGQGDFDSSAPAVSANGQFVAFLSLAD